jgi:hypothetical protein
MVAAEKARAGRLQSYLDQAREQLKAEKVSTPTVSWLEYASPKFLVNTLPTTMTEASLQPCTCHGECLHHCFTACTDRSMQLQGH